ncbi:MAG: tetratricopeptide repeat protein [Bacteroidota bacterium]
MSERNIKAQNSKLIDSLTNRLNKSIDDSLRIDYLNELSWQWRKRNGKLAMQYAQKALEISMRLSRKADIATSLNRIGEVLRIKGAYRKSLTQFGKALVIEQSINNTHGIARASSQLGTLYRNLGQLDSALFYTQESLAKFKYLDNEPAIGRSYLRLANIHKDWGKYGIAIAYCDSALDIQVKLKKENDIAHTYLSLGNLYKNLGYIDSARNQYLKGLHIRKKRNEEYEMAKLFNALGTVFYLQHAYDSALVFYRKSQFLKNKTNSRGTLDVVYNNLGNVFTHTGLLDSALHYYLQSVKIKLENKDSIGLALSYNNIGNIYKITREWSKSLTYYQRSLSYTKSDQNLTLLIETYYNLSDLYFIMGDMDKALEFKNKYLLVRDSLDDSFRAAIEMRNRYETEKRRREDLEKNEMIRAAELRKIKAETALKNIMITVIVLVVLFMALLVIFYFQNKVRKQRLLILEKDKNIAQQKVQEILKEQEIHAMNAMMEGQEGERKRIAQDLHDRLGSMLSMVKIHFKSVEDNLEELKTQNMNQYEKANTLLDEACEEVRKIAHDMVSGVLTKFGLVAALQSLQESVNDTGQLTMQVLDFGMEGDRLDYQLEINVYRIIQELLSNVLKHAGAREMTIQLIRKGNNLHVQVEDDGVGFDVDDRYDLGMGIKNIAARVDKLNGELQIDSGSSGTIISIDFPI